MKSVRCKAQTAPIENQSLTNCSKALGLSEKLLPQENLKASGFSEGKPSGFAFGKSLGFRLFLGRSFSRQPLRLFNSLYQSFRSKVGNFGCRLPLAREIYFLWKLKGETRVLFRQFVPVFCGQLGPFSQFQQSINSFLRVTRDNCSFYPPHSQQAGDTAQARGRWAGADICWGICWLV